MEEHKPSGIEWRQRVDRECDNPISPSHVESRRGKGGTFDYVSQYYIIQRMCEIFGGTGWGAKLISREMVDMREVDSDAGTRWQVVYTATMSVSAAGVSKVGSAAGTGLDRSLPDAIHSAITEAETDALKRACRLFGHSLGLALYDKEKAHVAEPPPPGNPEECERVIKSIRDVENLEDFAAAKEMANAAWKSLNSEQKSRVITALKSAYMRADESRE